MVKYHGTPISPVAALMKLAGCHFCVSHIRPDDVRRVHDIGQSVMLDNGAFSKWKRGAATDWDAYYAWADEWLHWPTTWSVIPDVIDAGTQEQDALLREWPHGKIKGAPVWHMDEPIHRLLRLCQEYIRVCIGSTAEYRTVMSPAWQHRMDEVFNALAQEHRHLPMIHMLRGMQCAGKRWPFHSADSTDVGQNHNRTREAALPLFGEEKGDTDPLSMARRWDALQTPGRWIIRPDQSELVA